ncbi:unnamed protein product, partial [Ectocarpus sp. 13 AM-2016]
GGFVLQGRCKATKTQPRWQTPGGGGDVVQSIPPYIHRTRHTILTKRVEHAQNLSNSQRIAHYQILRTRARRNFLREEKNTHTRTHTRHMVHTSLTFCHRVVDWRGRS